VLCSGEAKIVCVDKATMKPKVIPQHIAEAVFS
jgi:acyl-CoA thioesterase FadM